MFTQDYFQGVSYMVLIATTFFGLIGVCLLIWGFVVRRRVNVEGRAFTDEVEHPTYASTFVRNRRAMLGGTALAAFGISSWIIYIYFGNLVVAAILGLAGFLIAFGGDGGARAYRAGAVLISAYVLICLAYILSGAGP